MTDSDYDDENAVNREDNEVVSAIGKVHDAVKALSPATPGQFDITGVAQATHIKMRTTALVLAPSAVGAAVLTIGLKVWTFTFVAAAMPVVLPFFEKVDRGVDILIALGVAGAPITAYLIYTPE